MANHLYLIDGSGFIFRAYHALPPLTRADGTPVGAVMGFCNMLHRLKADMKPTAIAVVFDTARTNFRHDIYPEYKAHRPPPPEDLVPQFPLVRDATAAFGIAALEASGFEADDVIATYARRAAAAGWQVTIVSSDKDLMQLVDANITMMDPIKNIMIDRAGVIDKFGVPPEQVVDVQALCGDSTDNVPGVPGIGIKTAAALIQEYGDLETLLAKAGDITKPKQRENLLNFADMARLSKRLVALDDNVPLTVPLDDLKRRDEDPAELAAFLAQQGFKSLLGRVASGAKPAAPTPSVAASMPPAASTAAFVPPAAKPFNPDAYRMLTAPDDIRAYLDAAMETGILAIDTETTGLTPAKAELVGISLSHSAGSGVYIPLAHKSPAADLLDEPSAAPAAQADTRMVMELLRPYLTDPSLLKVGHNIKYDMQMFLPHGIRMAPVDDTMLLSYVLDGTEHGHGMDDMAQLFLQHTPISYDDVTGTGKKRITFDYVPVEQATRYAAEDADITYRFHELFKPRLAAEQMVLVYETIERPIIPVIADMEYAGVRVDPALLRALSADFAAQLAVLEDEIYAGTNERFNIASPKQLGHILFDVMGLPGGGKTKTGDWSTSADVLEDLALQGHAVVQKILDHRQLSKLKSTYTDTLLDQINPATGRVHTSFSLAATTTGRLASSDPNVQNIPIRTEEGRKIRRAFVADAGCQLISIDYSQIELRLAAEMAGIPALRDAFLNGEDIHARTASEVFGIPLAQVTSEVRRQAKAINFGIIYGISGYGLARQLGCEQGEAAHYIKQYFARFPELSGYMERAKAEAQAHGFVRTWFGRKCTVQGINDKNPARRGFAQRQAINAPLQGTAADLIKIAMGKIPAALAAANLPGRLLLQVHDELLLEAPADRAEDVAACVKGVMEAVSPFTVPMTAESGIADNWADA